MFQRHWTTPRLFKCATDYADALNIGNGCTYDWNTGTYSGTGTLTKHPAISLTGWIAGVIWMAFLAVVVVLFFRLNEKQKHQRAAIGDIVQQAEFITDKHYTSMVAPLRLTTYRI